MTRALYQPFPFPSRARAQIWRYAPEYRRPRHFHPEPELNLVIAGRATFGVADAILSVGSGDLLWWRPGLDHELLGASADFDLFVIGLSPELSGRVLGKGAGAVDSGPTRMRLPPAVTRRFAALASTGWEREDAVAAEDRIGGLWREAHAHRSSDRVMHPLSRRALASLREHPNGTRAEVSRLAQGHPSEVSRHFRRDIGLTLASYRSRLRVLRFIEEVDRGPGNLLRAAFAAGFGSYSQCHRTFQAALGCSPRVFFAAGERGRMAETFAGILSP